MRSAEPSHHADTDMSRRLAKAQKVHRLILSNRPDRSGHVLEIGTGSGAIAWYLATLEDADFSVDAVDVVDLREVSDGYSFRLVDGTILPYEDASFDVVISNHVLEHVGGSSDQKQHLSEMARVLRNDGLAYLATPNRWAVIEPHFRLPLLSWLPRPMADSYVRLVRRGHRYDCYPVGPLRLGKMIRRASLQGRHVELEAVMTESDLEGNRQRLSRIVGAMSGLARRLWPLSPTFVVILRKGSS